MDKQILRHDGSDQVFLGDLSAPYGGEIVDPVDPTHLPAGTVIDLGIGESTVLPSLDFETYSEAGYVLDIASRKVKGLGSGGKGGLPVVGTPVYAAHPSTEILCLYYDLKDGKGRRGWFAGTPDPVELLDYVASGGLIEAFNFTFEFWIWNKVGRERHGWPTLQLEQGRCVMARARRHSLPGSLAQVAKVLGTPDKDKAGKALINKLTRPLTPTKNRPEWRWTPATNWDDFSAFYQYCDVDVKTEDHAAAFIPDLTPYEYKTWFTDQMINVRGVQVDMQTLDAALVVLSKAFEKYTLELNQITGGFVSSVSEVAKIVEWLGAQGLYMDCLDKEAVETAALRDDITPACRRVLEIRQTLGSANVKKLKAFKLQTSADGRLRNQYMFCGADRTGRWAAGGAQLHNMVSKGPKTKGCSACGGIFGAHHVLCARCIVGTGEKRKDWDIDAVLQAIDDIRTRDLDYIMHIWGEPIDVLCGCIRGLLEAAEGKRIICCDFSAVEAVVAACLSRCQWRIDVFNGHGKIYEMSASKISGVPFEEMIQHKQDTGQDHPLRKTLGKVAELASGYAGWMGAWKNFGADAFMNDAEIKDAILKWRDESPEIVEMWGGQFRQTGRRFSEGHCELYGLEGAAVAAILNPGKCFAYIDITYGVKNDILYCRLPSGRFLHYHNPLLIEEAGKWGKPPSWKITFMGYNSNATKGPIGWQRLDTYGGRLFENVVQAVAADIQAEALVRLEANGYPVVMHTHDEASAELPDGVGSVEEMERLMSERPTWASWWPLRAAGWQGKRYRKD